MQTIRPYVYLLGGAVTLALAGCHTAARRYVDPMPDPKPQAALATPAQQRDAGSAIPVASVPGTGGVTQTVWIGPHTVPCDADNSGRCYRVRESENGPWRQWHGRIQGFNYVEGNDYELVVKAYRSDVKLENQSKDPASNSRYVFSGANGPFVVWVLDHVVSQQPHTGR